MLKLPKIELWITTNRLNFYQISECHVCLNSGVASPEIFWGTIIWGPNFFFFRRTTLFCLEKRFSKHKITLFLKTFAEHGPFGCPLATPMPLNKRKAPLLKTFWRRFWCQHHQQECGQEMYRTLHLILTKPDFTLRNSKSAIYSLRYIMYWNSSYQQQLLRQGSTTWCPRTSSRPQRPCKLSAGLF